MSKKEQAVGQLGGAAVFAISIWEGIEYVFPNVNEIFSSGNAKLGIGMVLAFMYSRFKDRWFVTHPPSPPSRPVATAGIVLLCSVFFGCQMVINRDVGFVLQSGKDTYYQECPAYDKETKQCLEPIHEVRTSSISEDAAAMVTPVFAAVGDVAKAVVCWVAPPLCRGMPGSSDPEATSQETGTQPTQSSTEDSLVPFSEFE